jgi:tetratricopeptide (TPR) repeat protein
MERAVRRVIADRSDTRRVQRFGHLLETPLAMQGHVEAWWREVSADAANRLAGTDTAAQRQYRGLPAFQQAVDRAWYAGDTSGLAAELRTYVAESRVDTWKMADRQGNNLVWAYIAAGDGREARRRLNAYRSEMVRTGDLARMPDPRRAVVQFAESQVLVAEGKSEEALRVLAPFIADTSAALRQQQFWIGRTYHAAGNLPEARRWLSRLLDSTDPRMYDVDASHLIPAHRMLCAIAETPAEKTRRCDAFAAMWKSADPWLQRVVAQARAFSPASKSVKGSEILN